MDLDLSKIDNGPIYQLAMALLIMVVVASICTYLVGYMLNMIKAPRWVFNLGLTMTGLCSGIGTIVFMESIGFI